LEEGGMEPGRWQPPGCGAVTYLDRLGFLDSLSLCVHVVQVSEEEIQLLQRSRAGVCLCPRSNLFIGNGLPPVRQLLDAGVPCAIGTDSLASNADLNLFKEMTVLVDQCGIGPDVVLAMATFHGARNLGLTSHYGVSFINTLPIFHPLESGAVQHDFDIIDGTPAVLNALLASDQLDLGVVSSIEYARHFDKFC
jgi:hypothetical protein